jgi:radical SAM protein with 4Fe4S-binding SPASM domain
MPVDKDIIRKTARGAESQPNAAEAIRYLIQLRDEMGVGLPLVQTQTTLVKENTHLIRKMAEFLHTELKPDIWGMQLCVFTTEELNALTTGTYEKNFGQDQVGWAGFVRTFEGMDFKELQRQIDWVLARKWHMKLRPYKPLGMKGFDMEKYFTQPDVHAVDDPLTCMNPYVFAQVQPNGDIAFCGSQPDYVIGNVRRERFLDLWSNRKAMEWRVFLTRQLFESCKRCFSLYEFAHFNRAG